MDLTCCTIVRWHLYAFSPNIIHHQTSQTDHLVENGQCALRSFPSWSLLWFPHVFPKYCLHRDFLYEFSDILPHYSEFLNYKDYSSLYSQVQRIPHVGDKPRNQCFKILLNSSIICFCLPVLIVKFLGHPLETTQLYKWSLFPTNLTTFGPTSFSHTAFSLNS